jgi:dTDP-4-dehydrorhamnose 3,5-epimerase
VPVGRVRGAVQRAPLPLSANPGQLHYDSVAEKTGKTSSAHCAARRTRMIVLHEGSLNSGYQCTDFYDPRDELRIIWNDPSIGVTWPVSEPILSSKDREAATLAKQLDRLPVWPDAAP